MRLLVVGCGSIGTVVANAARSLPHVEEVLLHDVDPARAASLAKATGARVASLDEGLTLADVVVECASQQAVREIGPAALAAGCDLVVVSVGALLDANLLARLRGAGEKAGARILVPSGALGALDALRAAAVGGLDEVTLTTAKPPDSLGLGHEEIHDPVTLFDGPASEAVQRFPKNVNVAAALALAAGREPRVRIVADPSLRRNTHTVEARGAFGRLTFRVENEPFPDNPATSRLAADAVVALLRGLAEPLRLG